MQTSDVVSKVESFLQGYIVNETNLTKITDSDVTTQAQRWLADESNNQWDSTEVSALVTMAMDRFRADRGDALHSDGDACEIHLDALAHLVCHYAYLDDADDQNNATLADLHLTRYTEATQRIPSTWTTAALEAIIKLAVKELLDRRPDLLLQDDGSKLDRRHFVIAYLDETWLNPLAARVAREAIISSGSQAGQNMVQYLDNIWRTAA